MDGKAAHPSGASHELQAQQLQTEVESANAQSKRQRTDEYIEEQAKAGNKISWAKAEDAVNQLDALAFDQIPRQSRHRNASAVAQTKPTSDLTSDAEDAKHGDEPKCVSETSACTPASPELKPRSKRKKKRQRAAASARDVLNDGEAAAQPKRGRGRPRGPSKTSATKPKGKGKVSTSGLTSAQKQRATYYPFFAPDLDATESEANSAPGSESSSRRGRPSLHNSQGNSFVTLPLPAEGYDTLSESEEDPQATLPQGAAGGASSSGYLEGDTINATNPMFEEPFVWKTGTSLDTDPAQLPKFEIFDEADLNDKGAPRMLNHENLRYIDIFENLIGGDETWQQFADATNKKFQAFKAKKMDPEDDDEVNQEKDFTVNHDGLNEHDSKTGKVYGIYWQDVSYLNIIMFFTIMLAISIMGGGPAHLYWAVASNGLIPGFNFGTLTGMSLKRYKQIKKFFTYYNLRPEDLEEDGPRKGKPRDKAAKVRGFISILQDNFRRFWRAGKAWAGDERLIPYIGRLCPFKVYMKEKPHKYGMKQWCLANPLNYVLTFVPYLGAGVTLPGEKAEHMKGRWSIGERVVIFFARQLPRGAHLFCDRFFTTPKVCWYCLEQSKVFVTGTCMKIKKNLAPILFKKSRGFARGFFSWGYEAAKHVIMVCWMDRTPVILASAMLGANLARHGIKRLSAANGVLERVVMQAPTMAVLYNIFMGDRLKLNRRGSLELCIICRSWVKKYLFALFDMALMNAYVIAKFSRPSLTHDEFLIVLHKQLLAKALGQPIPGNKGEPSSGMVAHSHSADDITERERDEKLARLLKTHRKGKLKAAHDGRKPCYVCKEKGLGYKSIKPRKPTDKQRLEPKKYSRGCKTCGVLLCEDHFYDFHIDYMNQPNATDLTHESKWA